VETLTTPSSPTYARLYSLDVFRGLTMVWMFGNGFGLQYFRDDPTLGPVAKQFTHAAWEGMTPWDLIQPFFMFIVGVAMPYAFEARRAKGDTAGSGWARVLRRSVLLLLCGLAARSIQRGGPNLDLINVLGQLAFTYVFAYVVLNRGWRAQAAAAIGLLILHTALFLQFHPAWELNTNFGAGLDRALLEPVGEDAPDAVGVDRGLLLALGGHSPRMDHGDSGQGRDVLALRRGESRRSVDLTSEKREDGD
jgi:predicted acyltransferase